MIADSAKGIVLRFIITHIERPRTDNINHEMHEMKEKPITRSDELVS